MTTVLKQSARRKSRSASLRASTVTKARQRSSESLAGALRRTLAVPRIQFARLVGRTERAVIDWETGKAQPQGLSRQRVHELHRLTKALQELFEAKTLGDWFDTPNPAFGGLKPMEVIERGESDRLWKMIFELKSGAHV